MTNTDETFQISVDSDNLEQINYIIYKDAGCTDYAKTRLALGTTTMIRLIETWKSKSVSAVMKLCLIELLYDLSQPTVVKLGS